MPERLLVLIDVDTQVRVADHEVAGNAWRSRSRLRILRFDPWNGPRYRPRRIPIGSVWFGQAGRVQRVSPRSRDRPRSPKRCRDLTDTLLRSARFESLVSSPTWCSADFSRDAVSRSTSRPQPKVLAVASGGGHWVQLRRIAPAFEGADVLFVTVEPSYREQVPGSRFETVPDATRWSRWGLIKLAISLLRILLRERPDVVISTGAAPGYLAIRIGRWLGARTMWIDSIANAEELSLSGRKILPHADRCLTQWPHLANKNGPEFAGAVL